VDRPVGRRGLTVSRDGDAQDSLRTFPIETIRSRCIDLTNVKQGTTDEQPRNQSTVRRSGRVQDISLMGHKT